MTTPVSESPLMSMLSPTPTMENAAIPVPKLDKINEAVANRWKRLVYDMFRNLCSSNQKSNTWVCIPQVVSNLLFLSRCVAPEPAYAIMKEIIDDCKTGSNVHLQPTILTTLCEELGKWEQKLLHQDPGNFFFARRIVVSPNYPKSYKCKTFMSFNTLQVEVCILPGKNPSVNLAKWIREELKNPILNWAPNSGTDLHQDEFRNLITLWKGLKTSDRKEPRKLTGRKHRKVERINQSTSKEEVNPLIDSNEKCPILAWISHYQIVFRPKLLDSQRFYSLKNFLHFRLSDVIPRIKFAQKDALEMYEIPCLQPSQLVYIIRGLTPEDGFKEIQEKITKMKFMSVKLKCLYIPMWKSPECATNIAKAFQNTIETDSLFAPNGFGDLAVENSEAGTDVDMHFTSNIQHIDMVSVKHEPDRATPMEITERVVSEDCRIIATPYTVIVWDQEAEMPVSIGRVNQPLTADSIAAEAEEVTGREVRKCCIS